MPQDNKAQEQLDAALSADGEALWNNDAAKRVRAAILEAAYWSQKKGSPHGAIEDCEFASAINTELLSESITKLTAQFIMRVQNELFLAMIKRKKAASGE